MAHETRTPQDGETLASCYGTKTMGYTFGNNFGARCSCLEMVSTSCIRNKFHQMWIWKMLISASLQCLMKYSQKLWLTKRLDQNNISCVWGHSTWACLMWPLSHVADGGENYFFLMPAESARLGIRGRRGESIASGHNPSGKDDILVTGQDTTKPVLWKDSWWIFQSSTGWIHCDEHGNPTPEEEQSVASEPKTSGPPAPTEESKERYRQAQLAQQERLREQAERMERHRAEANYGMATSAKRVFSFKEDECFPHWSGRFFQMFVSLGTTQQVIKPDLFWGEKSNFIAHVG